MTKPIILDGGMGRLLKRIGAPFYQPEWSAAALIEAPDKVAEAHNLFIEAGADIITTNTYSLVPFHIGQEKYDEAGAHLTKLAATIAKECADKADRDVKVAGCIPPVHGSYRPDLYDVESARELYKPLISEQIDDIDFWLAETISSLKEAQEVAKAVKGTNKPLWISFTVKDREDKSEPPMLRSGKNIEEAVKLANAVGAEAMLFNCSRVEEMAPALEIAAKVRPTGLKLGVYANAFGAISSDHQASSGVTPLRDITPEEYLESAKEWQEIGADIIGGCCGIMPDHIKLLSANLK